MVKRTLYFGNPAYLSYANKQLVIEIPEAKHLGDAIAKHTVPMEDIGVVMLDHRQITLTQTVLTEMVNHNVAVITCDTAHMPNGLFMPLEGHTLQTERFRYQLNATTPLKKALWQQTIVAKIQNQAHLLTSLGIEAAPLYLWATRVRSGDPDNLEARAAAYYWKHLFPAKLAFVRAREGAPPNLLLNYGYAILRALVARALVGSGLLPTLGIHHHNKYNAYCLADDIMEPYRPFVDRTVRTLVVTETDYDTLTTPLKAQLLGVLTTDIQMEKQTRPLSIGVQRTTASLAQCFEGTTKKLIYPQLV